MKNKTDVKVGDLVTWSLLSTRQTGGGLVLELFTDAWKSMARVFGDDGKTRMIDLRKITVISRSETKS